MKIAYRSHAEDQDYAISKLAPFDAHFLDLNISHRGMQEIELLFTWRVAYGTMDVSIFLSYIPNADGISHISICWNYLQDDSKDMESG